MRLYLVQHGDSLPKEVDPDRSLSPKGRADVERLASFLKGRLRVARVWHSGKTRARQTAELLGAALAPEGPLEAVAGIDPLDPTDSFADRLPQGDEALLVAGHQPFMGRLVARLVLGAEQPGLVLFEPGAMVCLERSAEGRWAVTWMVRPELLG